MSIRVVALTGALAALLLALAAPSAATASGSTSATSTSATSVTHTHAVPPPAPKPTDSGNSPAAPDPHPPRGGIGPFGEAVGGAALLHRHKIVPTGAAALPADLTARAFVLADLDTGAIIAARDPHGRYQAASIQKILTADTLLPLLPGDRTVTVSRRAAETEGSHAGLVTGGRYTIDQVFRGLLLVSGNDCAEALAEAAGGRPRAVALMNAEARRLGAYDTYVQTPSGLDGWQQLTSAYDMTLFLRAAIRQPRFVAYDRALTSRLPAQHVDGTGATKLYNQNVQFLTTVPGAQVAKTGFTDAAQHTFAGVIARHGHHYGVVLMRAQRYPDDQWVQATKLVDWGLRLRAGTPAVGRLAAPVQAATDTGSSGSSGSSANRSVSPSAPSSPVQRAKGSATSKGLAILILAVLAALGYGLLRLRRNRR